jgi:hypothetical protein
MPRRAPLELEGGTMKDPSARHDHLIWVYALGYLLCYAPYTALTKAIAEGRLPGMTGGLAGFALLQAASL